VTLPNPFPLSISLLNYWDGQPVTYVCRRRVAPGENPVKSEGMYWSVAFEIVDEDAKAALEKKGKSVLALEVKDSAVGKAPANKESASTNVPATGLPAAGETAASPRVEAKTGPAGAGERPRQDEVAGESVSDDID
jgi:hypothetical protein